MKLDDIENIWVFVNDPENVKFDDWEKKCVENVILFVNDIDWENIIVGVNDFENVQEAITYLLFHPEEAEKMGNNGRRAVENQYNWDYEKIWLIELYREL